MKRILDQLRQAGRKGIHGEVLEGQRLVFMVPLPEIERLNLGPVSTMKVSWDQPHEGNLFEFLGQGDTATAVIKRQIRQV